jgi:hypothetical protein
MARYLPEIDGPEFLRVYIDINGVETEVEAFVSKTATGEYHRDYQNPWDNGWVRTTDPEFVFEGFDGDGKPLIFTMDQMAILEDKANEQFWNKVEDDL